MLREFLAPRPDDKVVDLGCGSGRALLWNRDWGATMVGVDIAPFFSRVSKPRICPRRPDRMALIWPPRNVTAAIARTANSPITRGSWYAHAAIGAAKALASP